MAVILEAKSLSKSVQVNDQQAQPILKEVDLQIKRGEFVTVMGPSGSGKSTLLYNISGMDRATGGEVQFQGKELTALSEKELAKLRLCNMGFIFQHMHLLKNLNILDNIVLSGFMAKKVSRDQVKQRAVELMERVGISSLIDHDITQASGGQLQRVAICRALINSPDILFGDEPTGALNSKSSNDILDILAEINESGTTIMVVTHDSKVAAKSERVLFMVDGSIVAEKHLGKYERNSDKLPHREQELHTWLTAQGF